MKKKLRQILTIFVTFGFLFSGCMGQEDSKFYGEKISPSVPVEDFTLIDENGEAFQFSELEGQVIVVAFLFTRCPDICPIVSANLDYVSNELGDLYGTKVASI